MAQAFARWTAKIRGAKDEKQRRELLAEIGRWRVEHLTDIPAQREASHAMTMLFLELGQDSDAKREFQQLESLCSTPPDVLQAEARQVRRLRDRLERKERVVSPADILALADKGQFNKARKALRDLRRPGAIRQWIDLAEALAGDPAAALERVQALADRLRTKIDPSGGKPAQAKAQPAKEKAPKERAAKAEPTPAKDSSNRPKPSPRDELLTQLAGLEGAALDEAAAAALRDHVRARGARRPSPWLITPVARALLASPDGATAKAITELGEAFAVTAYGEAAFPMALAALRSHGGAVRRGVSRKEPREERVWTVGDDQVVVVSGVRSEPWPSGVVDEAVRALGGRIKELNLPGDGNQALRDALSAAPAAPSEPAKPEPAKPEAPASQEPSPFAVIGALFTDGVRDPAPYQEQVERLRRGIQAVRPIRELLEAPVAQVDGPFAALAQAMHRAIPDHVQLAEVRGLLLRVAARGGEAASALLDGELSVRLGGPGLGIVRELTGALLANGWGIHRVLYGVSRRERGAHPELKELEGDLGGFWRLLVSHGELRGEIWVLDSLTPAGELAAKHTSARGEHVIVVGRDLEWSDGGVAAVVERLASWE